MTTADVKQGAGVGDKPWSVGDRVAVNARTCGDDAIDFAGLKGTVEIVQASNEDKPQGPTGPWQITVKLDCDADELYDFEAEELCSARGFMPGATDESILKALLGKEVTYYRDLAESEDTVYVKPGNRFHRHTPNEHYRVERRENPIFDQVHFLSEFGFKSIYLSSIVEVKKP